MMRRVVLSMGLAGITYLVVKAMPDVTRYIKIRDM